MFGGFQIVDFLFADACSDYDNSSVFNGRRMFMYSMLTATIPILLSHGVSHASIPPASSLTERQPSSQQYVYNFIILIYLSFTFYKAIIIDVYLHV